MAQKKIILPEERGYIPGRAGLYSRKSAVIFPEERGYILVIHSRDIAIYDSMFQILNKYPFLANRETWIYISSGLLFHFCIYVLHCLWLD
jgi:hypothetical protein